MKNNILYLGEINPKITTNQSHILSNDSNPNPLWLDEGIVLASIYKRNSEDMVENLFCTKLIHICSSQHLIICNDLMKWTKTSSMTCIHGLGSIVIYYVIFDIIIYNRLKKFDILNDHERDSDHLPQP